MKLSEVYRYGLLGLFKAIILILLETILVIMLVMTLPLWWLKPVQYRLYVKSHARLKHLQD